LEINVSTGLTNPAIAEFIFIATENGWHN